MLDQKLIRKQLYRLTDEEDLYLDFVSALAGDRELTVSETKLYQNLIKDRGKLLYVDLLFVLTHRYYPEETAKLLWNQILKHKRSLSNKNSRKPQVSR
jgi:hypothetical protein